MKRLILTAIFVLTVACTGEVNAMGATAAAIGNQWLEYSIGTDGNNSGFVDKDTGTDYAKPSLPCCQVKVGEDWIPANRVETRAGADGDEIQVFFDEANARAVLSLQPYGVYLAVEVIEFQGAGVEQLAFVNIPLTLTGKGEPFEATVLALNEQTRVQTYPQALSELRATAYRRFGIKGARAAIIGCPEGGLRDALKEVIEAEVGIPVNPLGGPFALDAPDTRHSYMMDTRASITMDTLDDWMKVLDETGIPQLDWHAGVCLRFGDYEPNPKMYPGGLKEVRAITDKLYEAGHRSGLHTYAFFLAKDTPWVSPLPSPYLLKNATYTLASDLTADATVVSINESTEGRSILTSFFERNSLTVQIGDELIVYKDFTKVPPYQFIGCERGALGTTAAAHKAGSKTFHLDQLFNLFAPEPGSPLWDEIIARTVKVYNEGGFRMMYLDALDGGYILDGPQNAWHWEAKFVYDLLRGVERPPIMEMSTFHHHLWAARSRIGAWDFPKRGYKTFMDMHVLANQAQSEIFLPAHLGWWGRWDWGQPKVERMFLDDMEYTCAKALAYDMSLSLILGFDPHNYSLSASSQKMAPIVREYETLRNLHAVPENVLQQLRQPGKEFTLEERDDGSRAFHPIDYAEHKVTGLPESHDWNIENPFGEQPAGIRIQAELTAEPYDQSDGNLLFDFDSASDFEVTETQVGVTATVADGERPGSVVLRATNNGATPYAAWAKFTRHYEPRRDIGQTGFGLWVEGDGSGAVLNVQMQSPMPYRGGYVNYQVILDFTGRRYIELIEPESDHIFDYDWPFALHPSKWASKGTGLVQDAYTALFFPFEPNRLEWVNLWLNGIPDGKTVTCTVDGLRTVPFRETELKNPALTINGGKIVFPYSLPTGHYLEIRPNGVCEVFDKAMKKVGEVTPQGKLPALKTGKNEVTFACDGPKDVSARATVTVISEGKALEIAAK